MSRFKPKVITLVTGNSGKLREFQYLFDSLGPKGLYKLVSQKIDLPEIQGTSIEISQEKCRHAAEIVGGPCLVDDTSLEFQALGGLPGPYIKWFLEGLSVRDLPKLLEAFPDKRGSAVCVLSYTEGPDQEVITVEGVHEGHIVPPRGTLGFGWDPIFEPLDSDGRTYGEMTTEEKNSNSARERAVEAFLSLRI